MGTDAVNPCRHGRLNVRGMTTRALVQAWSEGAVLAVGVEIERRQGLAVARWLRRERHLSRLGVLA